MFKSTCMFCHNTRIFNIHNDYGNNNHTAKDDMLQFFGYQIESHLRPDDAICNTCMNIMDNVAKLKRRLLPLIFREESGDTKPLNLGKKWSAFASMSCEDDSDLFLESRSPTPSNLLTCKMVVPYESPIEMRLAEIERNRCMSRMSATTSSYVESELDLAFSDCDSETKRKRRKKRGHGWARKKNGRYSRASSEPNFTSSSSTRGRGRPPNSSRSTSRPDTSISVLSYDLYDSFRIASPSEITPRVDLPKNNLRYKDGVLLNKRTRSVSRQQEEETQLLLFDEDLHICSEENCSFMCENIINMTNHKVSKHKHLALFFCKKCDAKFTTSQDLDIHKQVAQHHEMVVCVVCSKEFFSADDLKTHWENVHWNNSVACRFCRKRFLDKHVRKKHMEKVHKKNKPDRIDYSKQSGESSNQVGDFHVRILVQSNTPTES